MATAQLKDARTVQAAAASSKGKAAAHADPAPQAHAAAPGAQQQCAAAAAEGGRPRSTAADARLERTTSAKSIALRLAAQDASLPAGRVCPADGLQPVPRVERAVWPVSHRLTSIKAYACY